MRKAKTKVALKRECLFHEDSECTCINPVDTQERLRERLEAAIRLDKVTMQHWREDPAVIERYEAWLAEIR